MKAGIKNILAKNYSAKVEEKKSVKLGNHHPINTDQQCAPCLWLHKHSVRMDKSHSAVVTEKICSRL